MADKFVKSMAYSSGASWQGRPADRDQTGIFKKTPISEFWTPQSKGKDARGGELESEPVAIPKALRTDPKHASRKCSGFLGGGEQKTR